MALERTDVILTHYLSDLAKQIVRRALAGSVHGDGESRVQSAGSAEFRLRSAGLGLIDVGVAQVLPIAPARPLVHVGAPGAEGEASGGVPAGPASAIQGGVADE